LIPYHGCPLTPEAAAAVVYAMRHVMVSFSDYRQVDLVADVCQSFTFDNGAFGNWRKGTPVLDWAGFYEWVLKWYRHPSFDWFLIPDVIDGGEDDNDRLIADCPVVGGVPVWHLHESMGRLDRLASAFPRVALGSSGDYAQIGTNRWERRMAEAMEAVCDSEGRPKTKLHGLRMLDPKVFTRFPFASADSTNVARNINLDMKWEGPYAPAGKAARGVVLAGRIEAQQSASYWLRSAVQESFALVEVGY